jgi:hypothetical protein
MPKRRDKLIIVTNGEKTEKLYLEYFKKQIEKKKNGDLTLDITPMGSKSEPTRIVNRAIELKKNSDLESLHSVWAIIEKDSFDDFQSAIKLGNDNGVKVVYSNVSIEYWFYCHFKLKTRALTVSDLKDELTKELKFKYSKSIDINKKLIPKTKKAIQLARTSHQIHKRDKKTEEDACSSTTVYVLIEDLFKRIS